jgi:hypothetical protein
LIYGFTESRTNKKNENMTFFMKILQGLMLKHVYILLNLNFPQSWFRSPLTDGMYTCHHLENLILECRILIRKV